MEVPENQLELLKEFRKNLSDVLTPNHTDAVLLKWLRARNYNLKKAENNFREVDANRKIFGVNTILDNYEMPEIAVKYSRTDCIGIAKDGSPIRYAGFGVDLLGFLQSMSGYDLCLFFSYFMESDLALQRKENAKTGRDSNEITFIFDLDGFILQDCMRKCVVESGMDFMRLLQDHYPECWAQCLVVNAPGYFHRAFNVLKPIFRQPLLEKIKVASRNETGDLLRKYIDEDVLPAFLGGKRVDSTGDPFCGELFPDIKRRYCKIPPEYFIKNRRTPLSAEDSDVKCVVVPARSVYNVVMVIKEVFTRIRVQFRTENGSMSLGVFKKEDEEGEFPENNEVIVPYEGKPRYRIVSATLRVQSHCAEVDGCGTIPWTGIYIMQFDNTGSWFTSKKLLYKLTISAPSESPEIPYPEVRVIPQVGETD